MAQCECGVELPDGARQCQPCARESIKKIAKYAALVGVILGLVCSSLPTNYQDLCKAVAGALSAC